MSRANVAATAAANARAANPKPRTISKAASEAGVHVETIRYYERLGLIARPVSHAGYRHYSDDIVTRLKFIKSAQQFGFTLKEIAELTGMADANVSCAEMCGRVRSKLDELDLKIHELQDTRKRMAGLLKQSPGSGSYRNCRVYGTIAGKI